MTPESFKAAGEALWGGRWISAMARSLHCSTRSVRRWAAGSWPVPEGVEHDVALLLATRQAEIADMTWTWKSPPTSHVPMEEGGVCYPPFGAEPAALIAAPTVGAPPDKPPAAWRRKTLPFVSLYDPRLYDPNDKFPYDQEVYEKVEPEGKPTVKAPAPDKPPRWMIDEERKKLEGERE